jgi:hypothetical protein
MTEPRPCRPFVGIRTQRTASQALNRLSRKATEWRFWRERRQRVDCLKVADLTHSYPSPTVLLLTPPPNPRREVMSADRSECTGNADLAVGLKSRSG